MDRGALPAIFNNNPSIHANTMRVPHPYAEQDAVSYTEFAKQSYATGHHELALRYQLRSWVLGYWLDSAMRGRAIAPRAVEAVLREAEAQGNVVRVALDCFVENVASRRVAEKTGFELEWRTRAAHVKDGKLRDIYTFITMATDKTNYLRFTVPAAGADRPALFVTEFEASDAAALEAIFNSDPAIHANSMHIEASYTRDSAAAFIAKTRASYAAGYHELAVRADTEHGPIVGSLTITERTLRQGFPAAVHAPTGLPQGLLVTWMLGYWVHAPMRGRGIVPRVLAATQSEAERQGNVVRADLVAFIQNTPSKRAAEKAGFVVEGLIRAAGVKDGVLVDIYQMAWVAPQFRRGEN
ncbi:hypothetical protein H9P43_000608 [Blastocladiella emersonii ATCC 22665]|nr:hypothetical protein H9P43_000608 [Blastocladiella emersonii ATCC 22665]